MFIGCFKLNKKFKETIETEILGLKKHWKKDLNNVKAFSSGWDPDYPFFDVLKKQIANVAFERTKLKFKPSTWWVNFYEPGHFTKQHHHSPEHLSSITFIKTDNTNPLYFDLNPGILRVEEEEGLVLIFDSRTDHGVDKCKNKRITLAVDFVRDL